MGRSHYQNKENLNFLDISTGLFRVRGIIHPPGISLIDGPSLKPFAVATVNSLRFCLVYLDGLHVGNYPSKICHPFWTYFGTLEISKKSIVNSGRFLMFQNKSKKDGIF